jgi:hypothetical protein
VWILLEKQPRIWEEKEENDGNITDYLCKKKNLKLKRSNEVGGSKK